MRTAPRRYVSSGALNELGTRKEPDNGECNETSIPKSGYCWRALFNVGNGCR
jgi:hypothetical protein